MAGQLRLLRAGHVPQTASAAMMAPIAQRLSDEQIEAVSTYFAAAEREQEATLP
jgi:cytochrome c553